MQDPRKLAAAVLCAIAPVTSFGCDPVFTTLAADTFNELQVGYVSNRNEEDTAREFAMRFRNGPITVLTASGTCHPTVEKLAQEVFFVSVDGCGRALQTEYFVVRGQPQTGDISVVDALLPEKFFTTFAEHGPIRKQSLALKLRYFSQYYPPSAPAEVSVVAGQDGFRFAVQPSNVALPEDNLREYRVSQLIYRDLYRVRFNPDTVLHGTCGPFSKQTVRTAASQNVDLCSAQKRKDISVALKYLQAAPEVRLRDVVSRTVSATECIH